MDRIIVIVQDPYYQVMILTDKRQIRRPLGIYSIFFAAPRPSITTLVTVLISLIPIFALTYLGLEITIMISVLIFITPYFVGVISMKISPMFIERFQLNNSTLISFVSTIPILLFSHIAIITQIWDLSIMGLIVSYGLRHMYIVTLSNARISKKVVSSLSQPLSSLIFLYLLFYFPLATLTSAIIGFGVFALAFVLIELVLDKPKILGGRITSLQAGRVLISSLLGQPKQFTDIDPEVGERTDVWVGTLSFRVQNSIDGVICVPALHPGPIGYIGGARLPHLLSIPIYQKHRSIVMVPHSPTTHCFNPTSPDEIDRVGEVALDLIEDSNYIAEASKIIVVEGDKAKVYCQSFGKSVLIILELFSDCGDVDYGFGVLLAEIAKKEGAEEAIIVDAHTHFKRGESTVYTGSKISHEIIRLVKEGVRKALDSKQGEMDLAVIADNLDKFTWDDGIGEAGIRLFLLKVLGQELAYITYDANSMTDEFRERLLESLMAAGVTPILMTTDTHTVHTIIGRYNVLGSKIKHFQLIEKTHELLREVRGRTKQAYVSFRKGIVRDVRIWGLESATTDKGAVDTALEAAKTLTPPLLGLASIMVLFAAILI
ncbi:MAG: DUF2070 family protein [Candidatus Hodarchaeota archaeon]